MRVTDWLFLIVISILTASLMLPSFILGILVDRFYLKPRRSVGDSSGKDEQKAK